MVRPVIGQTGFQSALVSSPTYWLVGQYPSGLILTDVHCMISADQDLAFSFGLVASSSPVANAQSFKSGVPLVPRSNNVAAGLTFPVALQMVKGAVYLRYYWGLRTTGGTTFLIAGASAVVPLAGATMSISVAAVEDDGR